MIILPLATISGNITIGESNSLGWTVKGYYTSICGSCDNYNVYKLSYENHNGNTINVRVNKNYRYNRINLIIGGTTYNIPFVDNGGAYPNYITTSNSSVLNTYFNNNKGRSVPFTIQFFN